jgi:hypothetical protein
LASDAKGYFAAKLRREWLTEPVVGLARRVWEDKRLDLMPILADTLQDAGCDDAEVLQIFRLFPDHGFYTPAHAMLIQLLVSNLGDVP